MSKTAERNSGDQGTSPGRPELLYPLFAEVTSLSGIGPRLGKLLEKLGITHVADLLLTRPRTLIDRRYRPKLGDAEVGRLVTVKVVVGHHSVPQNKRQPIRIQCSDETGFVQLVYFHASAQYLSKSLPEGEVRWVSGTLEEFNGTKQIVHPDFVLADEEINELPLYEPVYPLTAGLTNKTFAKAVRAALELLPEFPEWQDAAFRASRGWASADAAIRQMHSPDGEKDLSALALPVARLAFDELLASQLALGLMRAHMHGQKGRVFKTTGDKVRQVLRALPFDLTSSQTQVLSEIREDLEKPERMVRLLQGDVGAGKTVVALLAMAVVAESGAQSAIMAPTEILARQHLETIAPLAEAAGLRVALLTGRDKSKTRKELLAELEAGAIDIMIGTHALFQSDVAFHDLGLVVIDEQHRFGVHQRLALSAKGKQPTDLLVMTATPIPRTLTLALYGDMDGVPLNGQAAWTQARANGGGVSRAH